MSAKRASVVRKKNARLRKLVQSGREAAQTFPTMVRRVAKPRRVPARLVYPDLVMVLDRGSAWSIADGAIVEPPICGSRRALPMPWPRPVATVEQALFRARARLFRPALPVAMAQTPLLPAAAFPDRQARHRTMDPLLRTVDLPVTRARPLIGDWLRVAILTPTAIRPRQQTRHHLLLPLPHLPRVLFPPHNHWLGHRTFAR